MLVLVLLRTKEKIHLVNAKLLLKSGQTFSSTSSSETVSKSTGTIGFDPEYKARSASKSKAISNNMHKAPRQTQRTK